MPFKDTVRDTVGVVIIEVSDIVSEVLEDVVVIELVQGVAGLAVTQAQRAFAEFKTAMAPAPHPPTTHPTAEFWIAAKLVHSHP